MLLLRGASRARHSTDGAVAACVRVSSRRPSCAAGIEVGTRSRKMTRSRTRMASSSGSSSVSSEQGDAYEETDPRAAASAAAAAARALAGDRARRLARHRKGAAAGNATAKALRSGGGGAAAASGVTIDTTESEAPIGFCFEDAEGGGRKEAQDTGAGAGGAAATAAARSDTRGTRAGEDMLGDKCVVHPQVGVDASLQPQIDGDNGDSGSSVGDRRAHKMWVTNEGDSGVSEHDWHEDKHSTLAKDDTAVIEFHSQNEAGEIRFQEFGVVKKDKAEDIRTMVDSFTAPALAAALRDRETALHGCAQMLENGDLPGVRRALLPFTPEQVAKSRRALRQLDLDPEGFTKTHMYTLRKVLQRLPRHVTTLRATRASVMVPLCNVDGVASMLFTKRSSTLRAHSNEVCFPGGKVDIGVDQHIIETALREMGEEIGIQESAVDVLGVLRCDWAEVASLVGVAVTPVVGFLGNLSRDQLNHNPQEVSHSFTIPIRYLLEANRWKTERYKAPVFTGGPYVIWGLTGYILHRLVHDVLRKHLVIV